MADFVPDGSDAEQVAKQHLLRHWRAVVTADEFSRFPQASQVAELPQQGRVALDNPHEWPKPWSYDHSWFVLEDGAPPPLDELGGAWSSEDDTLAAWTPFDEGGVWFDAEDPPLPPEEQPPGALQDDAELYDPTLWADESPWFALEDLLEEPLLGAQTADDAELYDPTIWLEDHSWFDVSDLVVEEQPLGAQAFDDADLFDPGALADADGVWFDPTDVVVPVEEFFTLDDSAWISAWAAALFDPSDSSFPLEEEGPAPPPEIFVGYGPLSWHVPRDRRRAIRLIRLDLERALRAAETLPVEAPSPPVLARAKEVRTRLVTPAPTAALLTEVRELITILTNQVDQARARRRKQQQMLLLLD